MNTTFVQGQPQSPLAIQAALPHVVITGDLQLVVTESDVARGPIIGRYSIEAQEMQKPLQVCWGGEGQVRVNHVPVTQSVQLKNGDRVEVGGTLLLFRERVGS